MTMIHVIINIFLIMRNFALHKAFIKNAIKLSSNSFIALSMMVALVFVKRCCITYRVSSSCSRCVLSLCVKSDAKVYYYCR